MARNKAALPTTKREFQPTCGKCDNGWLYYIFETVSYGDGKKNNKRIHGPSNKTHPPGMYGLPRAFTDDQETYHAFYQAANRCPCTKAGAEAQTAKGNPIEFMEPMPQKLRETKLGDLLKPMR